MREMCRIMATIAGSAVASLGSVGPDTQAVAPELSPSAPGSLLSAPNRSGMLTSHTACTAAAGDPGGERHARGRC
jgi:hypothetical protein